jgi:hypothetical protein
MAIIRKPLTISFYLSHSIYLSISLLFSSVSMYFVQESEREREGEQVCLFMPAEMNKYKRQDKAVVVVKSNAL